MNKLPLILSANRINSRNPGIDIFRAVFALWVLFAHLLPWAIATGQGDALLINLNKFWQGIASFTQSVNALNPAVLGFIVLSGYCIHRNGLRNGFMEIKKYAMKRFFRIGPLYLLAMLIGLVLVYQLGSNQLVFLLTGQQQPSFDALLVRLTGITVFFPWYYPEIFLGNAPLLTVMVEIWLYIFYPIGILFIRQYGSFAFAAYILAILVFGLCIQLITDNPGWFQNASIYKYSLYWWIGAYFVSLKKNILYTKTICLCIVIYALAHIYEIKHFLFVEVFHFGLALIFGSLFRFFEEKKVSKIASRALGTIGLISYSLYALHAPVIIYCLYLGLHWAYTFIITVSIAAIVYRLIEQPTTRLGQQLGRHYKHQNGQLS